MHTLVPPHNVQRLPWRPWTHTVEPPHALHIRCRIPWTQGDSCRARAGPAVGRKLKFKRSAVSRLRETERIATHDEGTPPTGSAPRQGSRGTFGARRRILLGCCIFFFYAEESGSSNHNPTLARASELTAQAVRARVQATGARQSPGQGHRSVRPRRPPQARWRITHRSRQSSKFLARGLGRARVTCLHLRRTRTPGAADRAPTPPRRLPHRCSPRARANRSRCPHSSGTNSVCARGRRSSC